mmetsp:Transcript_41762/g.119152  ORF Transcript_41762/g.119152 Transcript_41762/m.119152 type:complete len:424 (+) Transcript_41762:57-1328(+)|eukprot:CAMPEP_0168386624 /NCGR_PEP_ID=MMETSP0228-20121227/15525_1 /TAXON_ID=133427 /ORGANISM="Protoceratium reticulatum, Strain CCCM 535 (=CCMP 1889)" /LENGTH=423 /DNA_ID=CAMNT_0008399833 /DNA_START=57 /DNA_END=1328 /DNA_ORIENTATION=+
MAAAGDVLCAEAPRAEEPGPGAAPASPVASGRQADLQQPKRPSSAFFLWFVENREALAAEIGSAGSAVAKVAGERWRQLGADESQPFEDRAARAKAEYTQAMADFVAQGGVPKRCSRKGAPKEQRGRSAAPKKPWGGAYGVFFADVREEIKASLPAGTRVGEITRTAGRRWREMPEAERKPYQERYAVLYADFVAALAAHGSSAKVPRPDFVRSASVSLGPAKGWKVVAWRNSGKALRWKIVEPRRTGRPFRTFTSFRALRGSVEERVYAQLGQAKLGLVRRLDVTETPRKARKVAHGTPEKPRAGQWACGCAAHLLRHPRCGGSAPALLHLGTRTTFGRGETCDVVLESQAAPQMLSRCHAALEAGADGTFMLTDKSVNGILVNGKRSLGTCALQSGDVVTFGPQLPEPELDYVLEKRPCGA